MWRTMPVEKSTGGSRGGPVRRLAGTSTIVVTDQALPPASVPCATTTWHRRRSGACALDVTDGLQPDDPTVVCSRDEADGQTPM
jgi:hypothetical protein